MDARSKFLGVLISVKPQYALLIVAGIKRYELRRRFSKDLHEGTKAIVYASNPISAVVGEAIIKKVHTLSLPDLWNLVAIDAMISKNEFISYYEGLQTGYAIEMTSALRYEHPVALKNHTETKRFTRPPQSYQFL